MDNSDQKQESVLLDFGGDIMDTITKLETIICNMPRNQHLHIYGDTPSETMLLIMLLREGTIVIREVYYMPVEVTEEISSKANEYLFYLKKRHVDHDLINVAGIYLNYAIETPPSDRYALFFPHIKAYVRCGNLSPEKLLELLQKDGCERVIVFNGAQPDENSPEEAFYSFEMQAPKSYIIGRYEKLQEERMQACLDAMEKLKISDILSDLKSWDK